MDRFGGIMRQSFGRPVTLASDAMPMLVVREEVGELPHQEPCAASHAHE